MDQRALSNLLADMIAAGGVRCLPARTPWPMHRALRVLYSEAGRTGRLRLLPAKPVFVPCPETGIATEGADHAFRSLIERGLILEEGVGLGARLVVDPEALVSRRRSLMTRDVQAVAMLQRAGERWAALASTAAKTCATPTELVTPTVASAMA